MMELAVIIENIYTTQVLLLIIGTCILRYLLINLSEWFQNHTKRPPGPIGFPFVGYLPFLVTEPHKALCDMKKKYGDVISLYMGRKYTVVLNEYSVMKEVLTHPGSLDRSPARFEHIPSSGFVVENGEKWIEQRRFCMNAARDLGLGKGPWEELIKEEVSSLVEELRLSQEKPVDVSHSLVSSVSSNIISLLIGRRLKRHEEADKVQLAVDFAEKSFTDVSSPNPLLPGVRQLLERFKSFGYDSAAHVIHKFFTFVREEIKRHKSLPELSDGVDFISIYLGKMSTLARYDNIKHSFSENMLEGNVAMLFLGSSDAISSSLAWLLQLMADHKDIQDRVYTELIEVLGAEGKARYEERHNIPYTFAVLMESQRFSSIVTIPASRVAIQDIPVRGYVIPKGTEIVSNFWAIHNDPNYWNEPDKFQPQRFLTDNGTKLITQPLSFVPFSIGRRNCPGETIAWMEILAYFTEIVMRFEICTPPGSKPSYEIVKGLVSRLSSQIFCFKERMQNVLQTI